MTSSVLGARRGAQTPRVSLIPPYVSSAASEVIDLAASAGLILDPWQRDVLTDGLGEREDGSASASSVAVFVARQSGKGAIIEALELGWLFLFGVPLTIHSSHEFKTTAEAFRRIKGLIEGTPDFDKLVNRYWQANGEQGIELVKKAAGARLRFIARSRTSGRGFSGAKNILDEAQELTLDQMAALLPTLSAQKDPQLWYFGTPPADATAWCYALRDQLAAKTPRFAYFDWGADLDADDPADVAKAADPDLWYECNPALGIRISEEFVAGELLTLREKFLAERLGAWPVRKTETDPAGIDAETWAAIADPQAERPGEVVFCVDVSLLRDRASISVAGWQSDGLAQVSTVDHRPGTEWIVGRLVELRDRWDPPCFVLDAKGPAGSLIFDLKNAGIRVPDPKEGDDPEYPQRGFLVVPSATEVAAGFGMFVDAARQGKLRHRDDGPLNAAVAAAKTRPLSEGTAWARKSGDITALVGATLAFWALVAKAPLADPGDPGVFTM